MRGGEIICVSTLTTWMDQTKLSLLLGYGHLIYGDIKPTGGTYKQKKGVTSIGCTRILISANWGNLYNAYIKGTSFTSAQLKGQISRGNWMDFTSPSILLAID